MGELTTPSPKTKKEGMGRHPKYTEEDIVNLFKMPPKEFSQRYNIAESYVPVLKYRYRDKIKKSRKTMEREPNPDRTERLSRIDELLQANGIDVDDIDQVNKVRVGTYEQVTKDPETGEATVHELKVTNVEFRPVQDEEDLQAQLIREAAPTVIKPLKATRKRSTEERKAIIVPDMQAGYRSTPDGLIPTHDEQVVDVGLQIIRHEQPDLIVMNGDNLDFAELSRYAPDSNNFQATIQPTLDRLHEILATMRANAPDAEIYYLAGNHEERLNKQILNHNMALWGIKRPGSTDGYPWLSVGHLLNLEELGIKYVSGYPANRVEINDEIQVVHGDRVRSGGNSAVVYAKEEELTTIYGHVHRREAWARTNRLGNVIMGLSYGCWADTSGSVPSYGNATDDSGRVVPRQENWQNGMGIIEWVEEEPGFQERFIHIDRRNEYRTRHDGRTFEPRQE